ncbi:hypothetical protein BJX70DRAFT_370250 [Aspergillus crustosus]
MKLSSLYSSSLVSSSACLYITIQPYIGHKKRPVSPADPDLTDIQGEHTHIQSHRIPLRTTPYVHSMSVQCFNQKRTACALPRFSRTINWLLELDCSRQCGETKGDGAVQQLMQIRGGGAVNPEFVPLFSIEP